MWVCARACVCTERDRERRARNRQTCRRAIPSLWLLWRLIINASEAAERRPTVIQTNRQTPKLDRQTDRQANINQERQRPLRRYCLNAPACVTQMGESYVRSAAQGIAPEQSIALIKPTERTCAANGLDRGVDQSVTISRWIAELDWIKRSETNMWWVFSPCVRILSISMNFKSKSVEIVTSKAV